MSTGLCKNSVYCCNRLYPPSPWQAEGSFTNYVDQILSKIDHLPVDIGKGIYLSTIIKENLTLPVAPTYLVLSTSFVNDPWRGLWWPPYPGISDHVPFFYFLSSPWLPTYLSVFLSTVKWGQTVFDFAIFFLIYLAHRIQQLISKLRITNLNFHDFFERLEQVSQILLGYCIFRGNSNFVISELVVGPGEQK